MPTSPRLLRIFTKVSHIMPRSEVQCSVVSLFVPFYNGYRIIIPFFITTLYLTTLSHTPHSFITPTPSDRFLPLDAASLESKILAAASKAESAPYSSVSVLHRHHFSSTLQRMSVVCTCKPQVRSLRIALDCWFSFTDISLQAKRIFSFCFCHSYLSPFLL
jgi:hypothetical protein